MEKNSRGCFISHDNMTLFMNQDWSIKITVKDNDGVWRVVGDMQADAASFDKFARLLTEQIHS